MPFSSPGPGAFLWSASIPPQDLPVELFLRNGVSSVPVALVPTNDGIIRMKNPKVIQAELRSASAHYQNITEVRQFGRGGILCFSPDQPCVQDLLKCSTFAGSSVSAFIPTHLACVKGLVRGVDVNMTPQEVLEMFAPAGAISVYRCGRVVENSKIPTESVIVTFAGSARPSEIKAWPLIYRVEALSSRPLQCVRCWRYGHTVKGCRSSARCRICGEDHVTSECKSTVEKCCLCNDSHPADYDNCPAKSKEMAILEIVDRRRCSRREAITEIQARSQGYAGVTARLAGSMEASLSATIADAVERAMEKAMERLAGNLCETLSQIMTNQVAHIINTTLAVIPTSEGAQCLQPSNEVASDATSQDAQSAVLSIDTIKNQTEDINDDAQDLEDMDMDPRTLKRLRSPLSKKCTAAIHSKTKKYLKESLSRKDFLKESILSKAVAEANLLQQ